MVHLTREILEKGALFSRFVRGKPVKEVDFGNQNQRKEGNLEVARQAWLHLDPYN